MSANYEWNKFLAQERVQGALHEAASRRLVRQASHEHPTASRNPLRITLALAVFFLLLGFFLTGCSEMQNASAEHAAAQQKPSVKGPTTFTMADRIRFQDKLWEQAIAASDRKPESVQMTWSMADRIRFQDRRWELSLRGISPAPAKPGSTWTIADRIKFQDRRESNQAK